MDETSAARINADLKTRTGIDFSRYRNPELSEAVANAVTFPLYLGRSLSRPVGALLLLALLAFVLSDSAFFRTLLAFPGILLVIANGVLLGLVLFVRRIGSDLKTVFDISTDLCVQALRDIGTARSHAAARGGFPGALEIFQGLNAIVILPIVIETLDRKVPYLGGFVGKLTGRLFSMADARIAARIAGAAPPGVARDRAGPVETAQLLDAAERAVESVQGFIGKAVDAVARVVALPFLAVLVILALISAALLYGAWVVTA